MRRRAQTLGGRDSRKDMGRTSERGRRGAGLRGLVGMVAPSGRRTSANSCVRRWLRRQRYSLWILLALVMVGLSSQLFVSHLDRELLEVPVRSDKDFPVVKNFWNDSQLQKDEPEEGAAEPPAQPPQNQGPPPPRMEQEDAEPRLNHRPPVRTVDEDGEPRLQKKDPVLLLAQQAEDTRELHLPPPMDQQNPEPLQDGGPPFNGHLKSWNRHFQENCVPKSHVVFLKTHKTAGSTIQNILYRYGDSRNRTFALPRNKHNQLSYPSYFNTRFVEGVIKNDTKHFDIMCSHMRFRKSEVKKLMPEDSFYFSILRHPVTMMESIFTYYKSLGIFKGAKTLDDFVNNNISTNSSKAMTNLFAHNNLAFDFGYDNTLTADSADLEKKVDAVIAGIERDFDLILINEHFDESMILLKRALCWSTIDVASFKLNSRNNQTRQPILPTTAEKLKRWNALDWKLYLHFNATFWQHVRSAVGEEEMKREVAELRELQAELTSVCLETEQAVNPRHIKDTQLKPFQSGAAVIQGYILKTDLDTQLRAVCQRFVTPELQYTKLLYNKQFPPKPSPQGKSS